jgi:lysozyme
LGDVLGVGENVRRIARAIASTSLLGVVIASLATSPATSHTRRGAPDHRRYPSRGIDVSHYQGSIDWRSVAGDGVSFAYIKATEGVYLRDARFARNWRRARRAGLRVGAYHYFIFCRSGRAQAHNFLAVAGRRGSSLPPAVDLEAAPACHGRLTGRRMRRELDAFLAVVEAREKRRAVLYVTPRFYAAYGAYLPRRQMWRRSILSRPATNASWTYWQYHSHGRVAGIRTPVDMDVSKARRSRRPASDRT